MKKLTKLLIAGLAAFSLCFSAGLSLKENKQIQEVHAEESTNTPATIDQVTVNGQRPSQSMGVTFEDGLLTILQTFYSTDLYVIVDHNVENVDLTVVVYKTPVNAIFYNKNGNLTVETWANINVQQCYVGGNLTIKGPGFFKTYHTNGALPLGGYSIIYVGEKFIVEDKAFVGGTAYNTSLRSTLSAKSIEINTAEEFAFGCNTTNPEFGIRIAAILIHDCPNVNELANRLTIKRGKVTLSKYFNEDVTEYNKRYGFVAWNENSTGSFSESQFDTANKLFTGYPITVSDTDLEVKARRVDLERNGGAGDYVSLGWRVLGSVVTLPECPYIAPPGQQFKGWALESLSATPLKQPGDTFSFGEGTDPVEWKNDYFNVYPIWEKDPNALIGIVSMSGALKYGETLTADVSVSDNSGVLSYQWRRNSENIDGANSTTYVVTEEDIGRRLSVVVTSNVKSSYLVATASGLITKADGPYAPTGITATACTNDYNNNGIISGFTADMEFKQSSSETWYPAGNPYITNLPSGIYHVRYKETATHFAGQIANVVINAYQAPTLYSVTVNYGTANSISVEAGTKITITANEPQEGYTFDKWVSTDGINFVDENNTTTVFEMPAGNVTVTATFKKIDIPTPTSYFVTVNKGEANPVIATAGTVITITANEPGDGYEFDKWVSTSGVVFADAHSATTTFVMPEGNVTVTATFKPVEEPVAPVQVATNSGGLSGGAVAGIIIASMLVAAIGAFALGWFVIKKKSWADFVNLFKKK